jgi:hypothetical protein
VRAEGASPTGWMPVPQERLPRGTAFQAVRVGLGRTPAPGARPPGRGRKPHGLEARATGTPPRGTAFQAVRASSGRAPAPEHGHPGRESKSAASLKNELDGKINRDLNQCEQDLVEFKKLVDGKSVR